MEFSPVEWQPQCLSSSDDKEMLLQWNLDGTLQFGRFRFSGSNLRSNEEYFQVVLEFLKHASGYGIMGVCGSITADSETEKINLNAGIEELQMTMLNMDVFNKLESEGIIYIYLLHCLKCNIYQ